MTNRGALAIDGGAPVRARLLPYGRQTVTEEDIAAVVEVLRSDWITTGPKVGDFEAAFAATVGSSYAVSFSSGTAALHGAAFAAGLTAGDEAITTPLTFCATANCVLYQGATPIFADVCRDTLTIDPRDVAQRVTSRTRAVLPVDYAGHPADLDALLEIAAKRNLVVIEDACHSLGATYRHRWVGSISHMTVFSFHPVKHLTTGEGGIVTTDNAEFAERLRLFRNHGIDRSARARQAGRDWRYEMTALGYNYRLSDIGCALGLAQLPRLGRNLERRRQIAAKYRDAFRQVSGLILPESQPDVEPAWHLYPVRVDPRAISVGRDEVLAALRAEGIGANVHYAPVHLHPYYRERFGHSPGQYPIAESVSETEISLPIFHGMLDEDVDDVVTAVKKVISYWTD